jgi:hypothetical protein
MKQRITRLSPHQNGKVFGVLMAIISLIFVIPLILAALFASLPPKAMPSIFALVMLPIMYLVIGYIMTVIGCWIYNLLAGAVGGIEFELQEAPKTEL